MVLEQIFICGKEDTETSWSSYSEHICIIQTVSDMHFFIKIWIQVACMQEFCDKH